MNIASILRDRATAHGRQPAIVERERTISFAELDRAAADAAERLSRAGVGPEARVLVLSPMSIDLYVVVIAIFRLGATVVFVDPSAGLRHVGACIARVRPHAFIGVPRAHLLRLVSPALRSVPIKLTVASVVHSQSRGPDTVHHVIPCNPGTPAIVTFTSGATGVPKAAVRTHGFLLAQHRALEETLTLEPGNVDLATLPIVLLANLASGVTSIIPDADLRAPGRIRPEPVIDQIRLLRPGRVIATPALLERLVTRLEDAGGTFKGVRQIFTGGAPVFPSLLDRVANVAPSASILAVYGSTEAEPIASLDRRDISVDDRRAMRDGAGLLAGLPARGIEIRILPDRWGTPIQGQSGTNLQAVKVSEPGEIVVSGDHVLRGYLDGMGDDETKIRDGERVWHRTGDAGYFDADGRLWLLGRCAARVNDSCGVLYPFAVECAASEVPGVQRSAFVSHRGRRILVVETMDDAAEVRGALLQRLAWARLADVRTVRRVPVDHRHNAKVDYPALARMLG